MPIYEYKCQKCGSVFEIIQKFSDEPLSSHADCGGEVDRLVSSSALQFKGSGFYITDYAKSGSAAGKPPSKDKDSGGSGSESPKPSSSGESKSGSSSSSSNSTSSSSTPSTNNSTK